MFNPIVDMALVNKIMGLDRNDTGQVSNNNVNQPRNDTNEVPLKAVGFNPYMPGSYTYQEFMKDAKTYGVKRDKNGNYIVYKYGAYRRSIIIIGIIIIFLQLCILGNLA